MEKALGIALDKTQLEPQVTARINAGWLINTSFGFRSHVAVFAKPLHCGLTLIVSGAGMGSITRLLFAVVSVMSVLLGTSYSADASKQKKDTSANASRPERSLSTLSSDLGRK